MKAFRLSLLCCIALAVFTAPKVTAAPLGTGFTYQGQLNQSGSPVTGTAHFRFSLWDAVSGGAQVGANQIVPNVLVSGGIFSVELNAGAQFGSLPFDGDARWLQVEVCTNAACSATTVLTPRQPLTGTPYAHQAIESKFLYHPTGGVGVRIAPSSATNSPGMLANTSINDLVLGSFLDGGVAHGFISTGYTSNTRKVSIGRASSSDLATKTFQPQLTVVSNSGNVGIGLSTPSYPLSFPPSLGQKISLYNPPTGEPNYGFGIQSNLMQIHTDDAAADIGFGYGSSNTFTERVRFKGNGNVGIGTSVPTEKLHVEGGRVRINNDLAAAGQENLRIIRGSINGCATGTIQYGSGFTLEAGCAANFIRTITFNTPFTSPPTVTATATDCVGCNTAFCEIVSVSTTQVRIAQYYRSDGSYVGGPLNFIAIGPR